MKKNAFPRRLFLRGTGGALVAAPFLTSVAEHQAKAQGLPAPAPPKRLIVFFTHNGCLTNRWFPAKSHGTLTKDDYAKMKTLAPMAPYADKLLMVRGIRAMNEWSFDGKLGQTNDPHTQVCGSFFTCHPVTPNNTGDASATNAGKFDAKPTGRSLDHICAEQLNAGGGTPLFLQIGGVQGNANNTMSVISWQKPLELFNGFGTPRDAFAGLTNLFTSGTVTPDDYQAVRRKSIVDIVRGDLKQLLGVKMSAADQQKLNDWMALLHDTSTKMLPAMCTPEVAAQLGLTSDAVAMAPTGTKDLPTAAALMLDIAAMSAACDRSRVIFVKMPQTFTFTFLGVTIDSTSLSHRIGNAGMGGACVNNALDMIGMVDGWYAQQFAHLVGRLDSFQEGSGTVLDNSATVWFQEMSDGNAHNLNNLPILQAGSCGGYFKVGQAVNVEGGKADLTPGHSDEDCANGQTSFDQLDNWGTPPDIATQPINKYYCNLMNAIGVKAGADGYPTIGGTLPVTKFGKYDDTTLFRTDTPSIIKNPGEYPDLRAKP